MMRTEFDEIMKKHGISDTRSISDEMYADIERLYMICDLFDTKEDVGEFVNAFGYEGVKRLLKQYDKRQAEIDGLRAQNSNLIARICKISKATINYGEMMTTMAKNFLDDIKKER